MNIEDLLHHVKQEARPPHEWSDRASCRGLPLATTEFSDESRLSWLSEEYCKTCPVFDECLTWAIANGEYYTWAGTNQRTRSSLAEVLKVLDLFPSIPEDYSDYREFLLIRPPYQEDPEPIVEEFLEYPG